MNVSLDQLRAQLVGMAGANVLRIHGEATVMMDLAGMDGIEYTVSGIEDASLRPCKDVSELVGDQVVLAEVSESGELRITFRSGLELELSADSRYESWDILDSIGRITWCLAGGEIGSMDKRDS